MIGEVLTVIVGFYKFMNSMDMVGSREGGKGSGPPCKVTSDYMFP